MLQPYFELNTLLLYIAIGLCIVFFVRTNINSNKKGYSFYILFILLLIFTVSRKVGINLGGMDSISYENIFINRDFTRLIENNEFLFVYFTDIIRSFTENPIIYRLFCYALIIFSYIYFIKEFCPRSASPIPYFLVMYPLLMSFNTMRNSMAVAMILIGLVLVNNRKDIWGILFVISSIFFHRMSIIYTPVIIFYYLFRKVDLFKSKKFLALALAIATFVSSVVGSTLQGYVLSAGFLDRNDLYYFTMNSDSSFTSALAFFIPLLLISIFMVMNTDKQLFEKHKALYLFVLFDIIIYPCTFIFGMWRANEYLYIPRLTLWAILLFTFFQKFNSSTRTFVKIAALGIFILWFVDRLEGVYKNSALMPYMLNWF